VVKIRDALATNERTMIKKLVFVVLLTTATTISSALAQESNFGRAVALTSTELFIGQPVNWYGPGAVYVYRADASGQWRERARLHASDSARIDDFGRSLATEGNTLIVGAPRKRNGAGVAYVFERTNANAPWRQTGVIAPPAVGNHNEFGISLVLHGNDLLIGSPNTDSTGIVYHYRRNKAAWALHNTIRPGAASPNLTSFGRSMSQQGDRLLVGAPLADSAKGRVYAIKRERNASWGTPSLVILPQTPRARVGAALLISDAGAFVGAPGAGKVFVIRNDSLVGELPAPDSVRGADFGFAIARVGNELWIGAPGYQGANGRVYRYARSNTNEWQKPVSLDADSADGTHWPFQFGFSIAATDKHAVVSMPQRDFGEGRVLALTTSQNNWQPRQVLEGHIYRAGEKLKAGAQCENGRVAEFHCANIEVLGHMPASALGGERGVWLNDIWGWTDPETGREYALVARRDGSAFVDISNPGQPRLVASVPRTPGTPPSLWRSIKTIGNYAFIVSDGARAHGMQVFDLRRLRGVTGAPAVFEPETTYHNIQSAHNVVADTAAGFVYIVGANGGGETCGGGLHAVDVRDALNPKFAGCYNDRLGANPRGYTHDAQCIIYNGPDTRYRGRQICIGSNEREINIADVTDKAKPVTIGRNSYPNVSYAHQGWFDDEQRYFYMNDEGDELEGKIAGTRTIVWDLMRLDDPVVAHEYIAPVKASDHNLVVKGNRVYEANYGSGLRVLDITNRTRPYEVGYLDSAPFNDNEPGHSAAQSGAWSVYPLFKSGAVIFSSVREGLFIVKVVPPKPAI
jgi:choice-of-anchor B domain-containing protein